MPEFVGIDFTNRHLKKLSEKGIKSANIDIEKMPLPFLDGTVDFIMANQVLEHCKEIYWINHEVFRCLKNGGYFFIGVPNILSLHNRILQLFGFHPTNYRSLSAHLRIFSKKDTFQFYSWIGKHFLKIEKFYASQFYPFPKIIARPLSTVFPNMAYSIFFLIQKNGEYNNEFLKHPVETHLETNFFVGNDLKVE